MARALRYRTGLDRRTGKLLTGFDHVQQSLGVIWITKLRSRVMRLGFGSDLRGLLGEDLSPALALDVYDELIASAHRHEPEFRLRSLQFVRLSATGLLALRYSGTYFPEGRFGNYRDSISITDATIDNIASVSGLGVAA